MQKDMACTIKLRSSEKKDKNNAFAKVKSNEL